MGRIVTQEIVDLVVPAQQPLDIWSLISSAASPIKLHGFELTSNAIAADIISCQLHKISAAGSGGSASNTEQLIDDRYNTAGIGSVRFLDTNPGTDAGGLKGYQWEQLGPVGIVYTPEARPRAAATEGFAFTWLTAKAATLSGVSSAVV